MVFAAPFPLETTLRFAQALRSLSDVRLLGLFQQMPQGPARSWFDDLEEVPAALDPEVLGAGVERLVARHGPVHRLIGILEDIQGPLALVRERLGIEGPTPIVTERFRDKALMKDVLREAGLPCARHRRLASSADAWSFIDEVGYPVVLKPPAGAGCLATYRVNDAAELTSALGETLPSPERVVLAEEFLTGPEHSFDTITLGGTPVFSSISRYYPGPLEVMKTPWIQWIVVLPRDISGAEFDPVRQIGAQAITALGLQDGMTHMEWFHRPDGTPAIGEIAARPPGAQFVKLISWAHDADMHRAWARAVVDRQFDGPLTRRYAVGIAFLRGQGGGRVRAVEGLDVAQQRLGHLVVESRLPQLGTPRTSGYEGEGYAILRHEDTAVVEAALVELVETVKIRYA